MDDAIKTVFNAGQARANAAYAAAKRNVTIDPITRLEGHGKIDIYLDDKGDVERAYFQVPELRGFEVFSRGRPAEDMPQITSRICGVCPTAHHMASTKALDDLYQVEPTSAGRKIRELVYHTFMLEDHALHVFVLGGPDFIVGPEAPPEQRNIVGVIGKVGLEAGKKVIATRRRLRELIAYFGGKVVHPVLGQPGGVSKALKAEDLPKFQATGQGRRGVRRVDPGRLQADRAGQPRLREADHLRRLHPQDLLHGPGGRAEQGQLLRRHAAGRRLRGQGGLQVRAQGLPRLHRRARRAVELHEVHLPQAARLAGLRGRVRTPAFTRVAPLARLNAADGMATPKAQAAYEEFFQTLGGKPVHHTLANHWARVVEMIQAAERMEQLLNDPEITSPDVRRLPDRRAGRGHRRGRGAPRHALPPLPDR